MPRGTENTCHLDYCLPLGRRQIPHDSRGSTSPSCHAGIKKFHLMIYLFIKKLEKTLVKLHPQSDKASWISHSICRGLVSRFTRGFCDSPDSSFLEPLITSFSLCCWQFNTSVLRKPALPSIVLLFSPGQRPAHSSEPFKQSLNDLSTVQRSKDVCLHMSKNFSSSAHLGRKAFKVSPGSETETV